MILLHLTWLLNSLHCINSYQYLPPNEMPAYSYGAKSTYRKYLATLKDMPYHVLVVYSNLYCSGALVRSRIVLTAASCMLTTQIRRPVVKVGADTVTATGQVTPVVDIKIHEYYKYTHRIDNDIAILMLEHDVNFDRYDVKKAILVGPDVALRTGVSIDVSGWGSTNLPQSFVNQLIWTEMTVIDKEECGIYYGHMLSPSNYCAKYTPERLLSDSGGPAVYNRELLVGILSYGGTNAEEPYIAILTNISYFHRWIALNTKRLLEKNCLLRHISSDSEESSDSASPL
ncbi:trypsin epsilon [Helicoverpa armigera]|uniref:trypsin epsilon n=1 Tax=Helicoverpa armigera TaxID=29058 RepID=UPI002111E8A4|nr:trypsin epsilon [Helicoverpa armigera]